MINNGETINQIQDFKNEVAKSLKEQKEDFKDLRIDIGNISSKISDIEKNTFNISKKLDGLLIHFDRLSMCIN